MRVHNIISIICLLCVSSAEAQKGDIVTGILILSSPRNGHTSFDLFIPGEIDRFKNLKENIFSLSDTAVRIGYHDELFPKQLLKKASILKNQEKLTSEYLNAFFVIPVEVEFIQTIDHDGYSKLPNEFYSLDISLYNKKIITTYNNKQIFFKEIKKIKLKE